MPAHPLRASFARGWALALPLTLGGCSDDGGAVATASSSSDAGPATESGAPTNAPTPSSATGGATGPTATGVDGGSGDTEDIVPLSEEPVSFPSTDLTLEGSLVIPQHFVGQLNPAVVLVHGSGPQSRDEEAQYSFPGVTGSVATFRDIASALGIAGYVVLRYDKRSCTAARGCDNDYPALGSITVDDFVDDSLAALDYVRARPEVDPQRVVYAGHSQGGGFVPLVLEQRPELAAGIMLAAPFRPIDVLIEWQVDEQRRRLLELGLSPMEVDEALADLDTLVEQLAQLRAGTFEGVTLGGAPAAFWESWFRIGDQAPSRLASVSPPILAISGDYDWNVPPQETTAWGAAFEMLAADPGHRAVVLPCITHLLNCVSNPDWMSVGPEDVVDEVDPRVIDALVDFMETAG